MSKDTPTNRRQFLKHAAAGTVGLATVGVNNVAAKPSQLGEPSLGPAEVDAAFETVSDELFDLLAAEGVLEGGLAALPTDRRVDVSALVRQVEGTAHLALAGRPDIIKTVAHVDGGVLKVSVTPETESAHAVFIPDGEDTQYLYDAEQGIEGVDRNEVWTEETCTCEDIICEDYGYSVLCCDEGGCAWTGCC